MFYRYDSGPFEEITLTPVGNDRYTATLPAAICGDKGEYYFQAEGHQGSVKTLPSDAPAG